MSEWCVVLMIFWICLVEEFFKELSIVCYLFLYLRIIDMVIVVVIGCNGLFWFILVFGIVMLLFYNMFELWFVVKNVLLMW